MELPVTYYTIDDVITKSAGKIIHFNAIFTFGYTCCSESTGCFSVLTHCFLLIFSALYFILSNGFRLCSFLLSNLKHPETQSPLKYVKSQVSKDAIFKPTNCR